MSSTLDPNTPILVGIGVAQQREADPMDGLQAYQLMIEAVRTAASDAGCEALLTDADSISVPKGIWPYTDPARLVATGIGASHAQTLLAEIGILQQTLLGDACQSIAAGDREIAIVCGGEAKFRELRATITGTALDDDIAQLDAEPDITLQPEQEIWSQIESDAGLGMPVGFYAILESALRHYRGQTVDQHRDQISELYERFSRVAVDNPAAWNRELTTAEAVRNPIGKNKMLAFPYTKLHNSQWNVDQAAGLIFCSVRKARELGIPEQKWVYPLASTESNHMVNTSQRRELHRCPGARVAGQKALQIGGISAADLSHLDMYSCFPAAVQIYAQELDIPLDRQLTVTGGMTFGGGPLNNYVLQASCRMAELLRTDDDKALGLVTSVSGMLTKQGFGLWSNQPGGGAFEYVDVTAQVKVDCDAVELIANAEGSGSIAGYTVLYNGEEPARAIAVCDIDGERRTVAYSEDAPVMQRMISEDLCGVPVTLSRGCFALV